jgi:hypothetical protein
LCEGIKIEQEKQFCEDVTILMKVTGKTETALDTTKLILDCLHQFAVGTDLPKKSPCEPQAHNLGLLRDNCCYESPVMKAENVVNYSTNNKDDDMVVNEKFPFVVVNDKIPLATTCCYVSTQNSMDGLEMFLQNIAKPTKPKAKSASQSTTDSTE